jgi:hypothetical protein
MKEMLRFLHSGDKVKLTDRTVYTIICEESTRENTI